MDKEKSIANRIIGQMSGSEAFGQLETLFWEKVTIALKADINNLGK